MKFKPRNRTGKFDWLIVCSIAVALLFSTYFLMKYQNRVVSVIIVGSLTAVFLYYYYLVSSVHKMMYIVQNNGIRIRYGFTDLLLPYEKIISVDMVRRSNFKKLFGVSWRDYFAGYFHENKFGIVQIYATTNTEMVYIKTSSGKRYAITPGDNQLFFEELALRWTKPSVDKRTLLYADRVQESRLWKQPFFLALSMGGLAGSLAQLGIIISVWLSGQRIALLEYSITGGTMARGTYYELLLFPFISLFFVIRMSWATDVMLRCGIHDKKKYAVSMLLIALFLLGILCSLIYMQ